MRHGSLFSGIGGFDLAAEWAGWENIFHCEINPFGQKVLKHYWPDAESHTDIKQTDFRKYAGTIDVLSGGFPCQPYSTAGKRKGKDDERHLWPEMLRAIREIQPGYVVGENVRGLTNWNGGLVFDEVQADLENQGLEVLPFLLPACAVNAPHRRDRIWFVAYNSSVRCERNISTRQGIQREKQTRGEVRSSNIEIGNVTDTNSGRQSGKEYREKKSGQFAEKSVPYNWQNFPTQSPLCGGDDGLPRKLDGITFPKWRNESIKAYGNAIVPQVAYEIFKVINTMPPPDSNN